MKDLNDYIYAYLDSMDDSKEDNDISYREDEMLDYLGKMPGNEDTKKELLENIQSFDMDELYSALFEKCGHLLSLEEYYRLKERFLRMFSLELPESCQDIETRIFAENNAKTEDELRKTVSDNLEILSDYFEKLTIVDVQSKNENTDTVKFFKANNEYETEFIYCDMEFRLQHGDVVYISTSVFKELYNLYLGSLEDISGRKIVSPFQSDLIVVLRNSDILLCKKLYG